LTLESDDDVQAHCIDTVGYTAAALARALRKLPSPSEGERLEGKGNYKPSIGQQGVTRPPPTCCRAWGQLRAVDRAPDRQAPSGIPQAAVWLYRPQIRSVQEKSQVSRSDRQINSSYIGNKLLSSSYIGRGTQTQHDRVLLRHRVDHLSLS